MKYALAIGYPLRLTAVGGEAVQEVELRDRRVALSLEQAMQWGALSVWRELGEAERPGAEELASLNVAVLGDSAEEILSALAPCIPLRQGFGLPMEEGTGIQLGEEQILLPGIRQHRLHAAGGVGALGGAELGGPQVGIGTDPHHGAALLVHTDQQGDAGVRRGGVLIALDGLDQAVGGLVRRIPAEENVAPQVIGAHIGGRVCLRHPDEEQLAHLFLQGQGGEDLLHLLSGQLLRRGRGRNLRLLGLGVADRLLGRGIFFFFQEAAGGKREQQKRGQSRCQKAFHKDSFPEGEIRVFAVYHIFTGKKRLLRICSGIPVPTVVC